MVIINRETNSAKPCECVQRRKVERAIKRSRIGPGFRTKTFDSFDIEGKDARIVRAFKLAKGYAEKFDKVRGEERNSLGIVGAVGSGKSHLLCAVANQLLDQGVDVRYFNFVIGFKELFALYDQEGGGKLVDDIRWDLQTCELLVLDDIAKGKRDRAGTVDVRRSVFDEVYAIVDYRYFNHLPILWSSELYDELADDNVLGEATASRLIEMSHMASIEYRKGEPIGSLNYRLRDLAKRARG